MRRISAGGTVVIAALVVFLLSVSTSSQGRRLGTIDIETIDGRDAVAREILVKFHEPPEPSQVGRLAQESDANAEDVQPVGRGGLVRLTSRTRSATALLAALSKRPDVAFAEPNYIVRTFAEPSDQWFSFLWGLKNVGQPVNGIPGTPGADIRATEAWDLTVGSTAPVIGIIDTGVDYSHPDIAPNMWSAPAPFTVNIGGVAVTCPAGSHGFNAITKTCDPMDDHNHGTHVAGTIGAAGNNGVGVAGVNWTASMLGLKFLASNGSGSIADAINAIEFALQVKRIFAASGGANVRVLSNSWGGWSFSQALEDQINAAAAEEVLFVAAAGNYGISNDILPIYPANHATPNMIAVAATTSTDARAWFSNYSKNSVHLGAPGADILSTVRGGLYGFLSGTSMATPHVSGAATLVLSHCPLDTTTLKAVLVDSVDPIASMATTTISGGRLNVRKALLACSVPADKPSGLAAVGGDKQVKLTWTPGASATRYHLKRSTTPGGPYGSVVSNLKAAQFTDTGLTNGTTYYYVVSAGNMLGESANSAEASATPKPPADMVVSTLTAPSTAAAGSPISISVTTRNQGAGFADASTTRFFISADTYADAADTALTEVQAVPPLSPGAASSASLTLAIPASVLPGARYLVAKSDADDVLLENVESNNSAYRSISIGPDLVVSRLVVPAVAAPGGTISAAYTVQNRGAAPAAATRLEMYWSTDNALDTGDQLLARVDIGSLGANGTQSGEAALTIPANASLGTYYIFARVDPANAVGEVYESNNTERATIRVGGDLVVSSLSIPWTVGAGVPFVATDTTTNVGGSPVSQSSTQFYLSPDALFSASDTLLGSRTVSGLAAGGASTANTTLTIPSGTQPGTHYLFAVADGANSVVETLENNNTALRSIRVGPDLVVWISSVGSPLRAGSTTIISDTTTNTGANDASPSVVRYHLSTNFSLDAGDMLLAETRSIGTLAPNGTSSGTTTVTIPTGIAPGTYYVIAQADGGETVAEISETNNTHWRQVRVE